jgi:hypothetical protein
MLLGDNSIHKCHRSERSAPEERRDFSIEHGYPLRDYRSEILKRISQPRVEEAATNEVAACSQIGRAQKYHDLKQRAPISIEMNKYIDETVSPVILNHHCSERKTC